MKQQVTDRGGKQELETKQKCDPRETFQQDKICRYIYILND